ncbi:MAG: EAL domain-containing protein [Rubrivivax sp.]|nr:EAL domain-containing protein [Rubrivivax sp.]MBK8529442.1 EAL domain-containing protein [Rubrivivax sp.]
MQIVTAHDARSLRAAIMSLYIGADLESAKLRAAHLQSLLRLAPCTVAASIGGACLVVWTFWPALPAGMGWWWITILLLSMPGFRSCWPRRRQQPETASVQAVNLATLNAGLVAGVWALMPLLWFADGTARQQLVLATLVTGMMGAGGLLLSALPLASLAHVTLFALAALAALWQTGNAAVAGLIGVCAPMVTIGSLALWRHSTDLLRERARAAGHERTLTVLLNDFEQHADEALWETGADGHLRHLSPRLAELLGASHADIRAHGLLDLIGRRSLKGADALRQTLDQGRPFRDLQLTMQAGSVGWHLSIHGKRMVDERGLTLGWRGVMADVTEKVKAERRLRRLAHSDSLTGLANRFMLRDSVSAALHQGQPLALLMLDLDHFKTVNDSLGHSVGDELLKAVAQRLRHCVRPTDLVARLGGDEFAVFVTADGDVQALQVLAARLVEALAQPMALRGRSLRVAASVGVADTDNGDIDVDELLARADAALYAAKASGRGRFVVYEARFGERSRRRLSLEQGLRQALDAGQMSLHWQPKVDIARWRICGAEALMRWQHPELGKVDPSEFIAVAEQCGLIDELGRWALRQACLAATGPLATLTVAVNVSPLQLRDDQFVALVRDTLRETRMQPSRLELEITESVFMDDADGALDKLHALRSLGVRVALDDFGTGYSSLAYLRRFPFDTLKIDRAFVNEVLVRNDARAIVQMIAQLATTLGMRTVCEGVESAAQLQAVTEAGCQELQGYLVSPPLPLSDLLQLQRSWGQRVPRPCLVD